MEKSSPTNVEPKYAKASDVEPLKRSIARGVPFASYEFVDVIFNATARGDTEIPHQLLVADPETIRWIVVSQEFGTPPVDVPYVYRDGVRPWSKTSIVLKCNIASARMRLLIFSEVIS